MNAHRTPGTKLNARRTPGTKLNQLQKKQKKKAGAVAGIIGLGGSLGKADPERKEKGFVAGGPRG